MGIAGLACLLGCAVPLAAPGTALVPSAFGDGPGWLLGLYGDGTGVGPGPYLVLLCLAFAAYLCVIVGAAALPGRLLWSVIAVLIAAFALAPPLLSQDVFSYVSYARLGVEHGLNPYLHIPSERPGDPAFAHLGWPDSVSAYGPLFTLLSYPLGSVGVPVALWVMKAASALSVLGVAVLGARLAPGRGLDPRTTAALIALNPLVLVHVVGGAHNDGLMMLLALAGVAAVLALREGEGAVALLASAALKVSAGFVAPFALIGAARRRRFLLGAAVATASPGRRRNDRLRPPRLRRDRPRRREPGAREPPQPPSPRLAAHRRQRRLHPRGRAAALRARLRLAAALGLARGRLGPGRRLGRRRAAGGKQLGASLVRAMAASPGGALQGQAARPRHAGLHRPAPRDPGPPVAVGSPRRGDRRRRPPYGRAG